MLKLQGVSAGYGGTEIIRNISLEVNKGEVVTIVGANGAGKTTTLRTICGIVKPTSGKIEFEGQQINGLGSDQIVNTGITMIPEGRQLFPFITVKDNLLMGSYKKSARGIANQRMEEVLEIFPRVRERLGQLAGSLSGGEQQMLAVARALMGHPDLLILDEPSMGLAPVLVDLIFETIEKINKERGITILLVEQNALAALRVGDYAYVLESGSLKLEGNAKQLATDPAVIEAYLGGH